MRINELLKDDTPATPLLEGQTLAIYEELLPLFLIEEDGGGDSSPADGGTPPDVTPDPPPVQPPGGGGWYRPYPGHGPVMGGLWFNQLYRTLKSMIVAQNISKRLKQIGVKGEGAKRIKLAAKVAAKHVKLLLNNPGATAYRIPVWTTQAPPKPIIKKWNEEFKKAFASELQRLHEENVGAARQAMELAAKLLDTKVLGLVRAPEGEAETVIDAGKQLRRQLIKTADSQWVVIHYRHGDKEYVRVESPTGEHGMYKVK